jgi:hypothetical protein
VPFRSAHAYRDFVASVRRSFRYVRANDQQAFLNAVAAIVSDREVTMDKGQLLWRAQLGNDWRHLEQDGIDDEVPAPYRASGIAVRPVGGSR